MAKLDKLKGVCPREKEQELSELREIVQKR